MLTAARLEAFVQRCPIDTPAQTSFGTMHDRPAVSVRITDGEGARRWGEIWCSFPTVGAEHRDRWLDTVFAPLLVGSTHASPTDAFEDLSRRNEVLAIQCADLAKWDGFSRLIAVCCRISYGAARTSWAPRRRPRPGRPE